MPLGQMRSAGQQSLAAALLVICCGADAAAHDIFLEIITEKSSPQWHIDYPGLNVTAVASPAKLPPDEQATAIAVDRLGQEAEVAALAVTAVQRACATHSVQELTVEREILKNKKLPAIYAGPDHPFHVYRAYGAWTILFEKKTVSFVEGFCLRPYDFVFSPRGQRIALSYRVDGDLSHLEKADAVLVYDEEQRAIAAKYSLPAGFLIEALHWSDDGDVLAVIASHVQSSFHITDIFLAVAGHPVQYRQYKIVFLTASLGVMGSVDLPGNYPNPTARFVGIESSQ
jgi:hypothetical protein